MTDKPEVVVLMGHGSRDEDGATQFVGLLQATRSAAPDRRIEAGFLEFGGPGLPFIPEGLEPCIADGVPRIRAIPVLPHEAAPTNDRLPREVPSARARHPSLAIEMTPGFTVSPRLLEIVDARIRQAATELSSASTEELAVLLVGRGT